MKTNKQTKNTIKRMKRQATDKEKIFAKLVSDKGQVCKIYEEFLKLNNKETSNET